ncbi:MAG: glycosyltransferase family 87 protein [Chloroflexaceae bacterium]
MKLLYGALPALGTLLLATLFWLTPTTLRLDVGALTDSVYLQNFHDREYRPLYPEETYRWSGTQSAFRLPAVSTPAIVQLRLAGAGAGTPVHIATPTELLARFEVAPEIPRVYRMLWHGPVPADGTLRLQVEAGPAQLPNEERELGLLVDDLVLQQYGLSLPPLIPLTALALVATFAWGLLRLVGLPRMAATLTATGIGAAPALGWGLVRLPVAPFLVRLAGLALLVWAIVGLARLLAPPRQAEGRLVVRRADLGIYLGLAWWAMPLFQIILTFDGARVEFPLPITQWIGVGLGVIILLALALRYDAVRRVIPLEPRTLLLGALTLAAFAHMVYFVWYAYQRGGPDFWIQFASTQDFMREGEPLYSLAGIEENHFGYVFKWPPFIAMLLRPFVDMYRWDVLMGYRLINTTLLGVAALLLLLQTRTWTLAACIVIIFSFRPATDAIAFGQVDAAILCGLVITLLALRRGWDDLAGAIVALLALLKIFPILLFGLFLIQRRWRAFRGGLLAGLLYAVAGITALGWQVHALYFFQVLPRISGGTAWIENQTFNGFLSRLFTARIASDKFEHPVVTLATYAFFALTLGVALLLALPLRRRHPDGDAEPVSADQSPSMRLDQTRSPLPLQFSLFILLMVLSVPTAWMHYHTLAILPLAMLLLHSDDEVPLGWIVLLAAAYALPAYGNQWSFFRGTVTGGFDVLGYSYKFYGLLLLYGLTVFRLWTVYRPAWLTTDERPWRLRDLRFEHGK